jgi:hypothetical protein
MGWKYQYDRGLLVRHGGLTCLAAVVADARGAILRIMTLFIAVLADQGLRAVLDSVLLTPAPHAALRSLRTFCDHMAFLLAVAALHDLRLRAVGTVVAELLVSRAAMEVQTIAYPSSPQLKHLPSFTRPPPSPPSPKLPWLPRLLSPPFAKPSCFGP